MNITSPLLLSMGIRDRNALDWIKVKAPMLLAMGLRPISEARREAELGQRARAASVGRDLGVVNGRNLGHGVRLKEVRAEDGTVLREADVEVADEDEVQPDGRRMVVRYARRADPLRTLWKRKSISNEQFDAAESLRADMEAATRGIAGASQSDVHVAPWARAGITGRQIEASEAVRGALAEVAAADRLTMVWLLGGGTLRGLALFARVADVTAVTSLRRALDAIARYYDLKEVA